MAIDNKDLSGHAKVLRDGRAIPLLGLGLWQIPNGDECIRSVSWALELGYRHIDTAQAYGNEESVGVALRNSGIPREDIFITTKFLPSRRDPVAEVELSLSRLGTDYVDLYLVHWPQINPTLAWPGMERAYESGYARSIGISNFDSGEMEALLNVANVVPTVHQMQLSPFEYRTGLITSCEEFNIAVEAYSPLGTGSHLSRETVKLISERTGHSPAQVLLRWCIQHGFVVLTKSTHRERIRENGDIFDFTLSENEMLALDGEDETGGTDHARERKWW